MATNRLEPGMLIRTSYGTGVYRIKRIDRGCTCPSFQAGINATMDNPAPRRKPHIHIVATLPDGSGHYFLNDYDEKTLKNLEKSYGNKGREKRLTYSWIEIVAQDRPIQGSLEI